MCPAQIFGDLRCGAANPTPLLPCQDRRTGADLVWLV
jgi:hypothetical protein